ncbi:uncharacterized protein N7473_006315 [Penicillium subrubescens]|nr:uncharacterized protein N7473_006315 [Penicillium subrubescens]KAJ5896916.1 hypothetical protein N7473_006315 [Penicillium subrubescens]
MWTQKRALRASCDNCHQAKVKCIPTASGCQRCLGLNALCIHSPPGRSGRAPAARPRSSGGHQQARQPLHVPTPPQSNPSQPLSEFNDLTHLRNSDNDEDIHTQGAHSSVDYFSTIVENEAHTIEPIDPMLADWFASSSVNPLQTGDPGGSMAESSNFYTSSHGTATPIPQATSDFVPGVASTSSKTNLQSLSGTQRGHAFFGSNSQESLCACFHSIIRALEKIQCANLRLLTLDVALTQNKEALLRVCNALKCGTPHDSTTRLVILLLLRKNLHFYHLIYQSRLRDRREVNNETPNASTTSLWSSLESHTNQPSQGHDSVFFTRQIHGHNSQGRNSRLTLGTYQLEGADEASLTKHILLLDVKKVPRLLERLDQRACGLDEADGLDMYNIMRSALIAEFRMVMMDVEA